MTSLPLWIDRDAWDGFVHMRTKAKKPLTARAELLILKALFELKKNGHDPNASLDQSTLHTWADVYPPQQRECPNLVKRYYEPEPEMSTEQWESANRARKQAISALKRVV